MNPARQNRLRMRFVLVLQLRVFAVLGLLAIAPVAQAQADLDIDTPAIQQLTASMQKRHSQLAPYYTSGAAAFTRDGLVAMRDASAIPLAQRAQANALIAAENQDRISLYREIARANGHPEWEAEIRAKFGERWIAKAQPGWWIQESSGGWKKK